MIISFFKKSVTDDLIALMLLFLPTACNDRDSLIKPTPHQPSIQEAARSTTCNDNHSLTRSTSHQPSTAKKGSTSQPQIKVEIQSKVKVSTSLSPSPHILMLTTLRSLVLQGRELIKKHNEASEKRLHQLDIEQRLKIGLLTHYYNGEDYKKLHQEVSNFLNNVELLFTTKKDKLENDNFLLNKSEIHSSEFILQKKVEIQKVIQSYKLAYKEYYEARENFKAVKAFLYYKHYMDMASLQVNNLNNKLKTMNESLVNLVSKFDHILKALESNAKHEKMGIN